MRGSSVLPEATAQAAGPSGIRRTLPFGAEAVSGGVHFRVWAPAARRVAVRVDGLPGLPLEPSAGGWFEVFADGVSHGARYAFSLDGGDPLPDPASRFQPDGPFGSSMVVDPGRFGWTDGGWRGIGRRGLVLYEMHVGTFTAEGTWRAAAQRLPALREVGINAVEVMPVHEFAGEFGWGYDGVDLFAPTRLYGEPDDLRAFVDEAHGLGIAVILDVVYNHLGPSGNFLKRSSSDYFSAKHTTEWGEALNFDGENSGPVREFFVANGRYWIKEFHFDGLRLDATQAIFDDRSTGPHILGVLSTACREAAGGRGIWIVGENEPQDASLLAEEGARGGGLDALWNDDFHHSAVVALTGRREAYYNDYLGTAREFVAAIRHGFLFQGQLYAWQRKGRGTPVLGLAPERLVTFLENHDQVANTGSGERLHRQTSPGRWRAMTALLLLGPNTPMLLQGQEFGSSKPFRYFADHEPELAGLVAEGRKEFVRQFPSLASQVMQDGLAPPHEPATFSGCKLDWAERERHAHSVARHTDLLALRRAILGGADAETPRVDAAALDEDAFLLRYLTPNGVADRLLVVNLGRELRPEVVPEPLLAPPLGGRWVLEWSSEHPRYGGAGPTPVLDEQGAWTLPGQAAVLMRALEATDAV